MTVITHHVTSTILERADTRGLVHDTLSILNVVHPAMIVVRAHASEHA